MSYRKLFVSGALTGLGLIAAATDAAASGFAIRENSAEAVGTVFAGAASRADDLSTVFDNPAGMTMLSGTQLEFGAAAPFITANFHGTASQPAGLGPVLGNTGNDGGRTGLVPDLYAVTDVTDRLKAGIAITAPFGNIVKYNSDFYGRYLVTENAALSTDINPNIAYKVNDKLSVGGGISAQYFSAEQTAAINQGAILVAHGAPLSALNATPDGYLHFRGSDWGVGYNLGALLEPWTGTRFGLAYRSKVDHRLSGDGNYLAINPALGSFFPSGPGHVDVALPASTTFSVTHQLNAQWSLSSDIQWTQWSSFKTSSFTGPTTVIEAQDYRDSWMATLGAVYALNDRWTLRGGLGWDQSPITNRYRMVALPDQDRYMIGTGFAYKISDQWVGEFAYAHYFATHSSMNDSINNTDQITGTMLTGTYQLSIDYLIATVRYKF